MLTDDTLENTIYYSEASSLLSEGSTMSATSDLHAVLGASGGTGGAVVHELARRGLRARAVSRRGDAEAPGGVERVAADVATAEGAKAACAGAAVVYHCVQPPYTRWPQEFPPLTDAIAAARPPPAPSWCWPTTCTRTGRPTGR
jgi:shikimate 5-dehydrogenase